MNIRIPEIPGMECPAKSYADMLGLKQGSCFDFRHLAPPCVDVSEVAEANAPYLGYSYHVSGNVFGYMYRNDEPAGIVVGLDDDFKASSVVDTFFEQIDHYQIRYILTRLPGSSRQLALVLLAPGESGLPQKPAS